jgi:hypothetical protein
MPEPPDDSSDSSPLLPHGGYEKLRSYKVAEAVYDATVVCCNRFIDRGSRTHDQMVQAAYLLKRQLESQARGFTESLHATRSKARAAQGTSPKGPPCPLCGQPTRRRTAANGPRPGKEFWGCTKYPDCRGIIDIRPDESDMSDQSDSSQ